MYDDCDMCIYDQAEMNTCFSAVAVLGYCGDDDMVCLLEECYDMVNQLTGCAYEHCIDSIYGPLFFFFPLYVTTVNFFFVMFSRCSGWTPTTM